MSNQGIQQYRHAVGFEPLSRISTPSRSLSEPPCQVRAEPFLVPESPGMRMGIWECSPGSYWREVVPGELMHFLSGECRFEPESGDPVEIRAGDTLVFPPNTFGTWVIHTKVRKVYALF